MGSIVTEMDQRGQQSIDEDELALGTRPDSSPTSTRGEDCLVAVMP